MKRLLFLVPVAVFAILAIVFYDRLIYGDPTAPLPSPLIGKAVPEFPSMPFDAEAESFTRADLTTGRPTIVNFWGSWCAPCVVEAPVLERLSQRPDVTMYGVVHKDDPAKARAFLARYGNPFDRLNNDPDGQVMIEWGVTKIPETFVIDGKGVVLARVAGALTDRTVRDIILPALEPKKQ